MAEIILTTLNAKYIHAAFGLRYLLANLGPLRQKAQLIEFDIQQRPVDIAEAILSHHPKIVGLGVYIWNVTQATEVVAVLKKIRHDIIVVLGGPEVSFEVEQQEIIRLADYVITGEADLKFADLCSQLLAGTPPAEKVIPAELPDLSRLVLPYEFYSDDDIANRVIYVEASRGCPFTCEFCLSSLDVPVRQFPLEALLANLEKLMGRGVKCFKFVDRTFNLNIPTSHAILRFFLQRYRPGLFVHFEMIPDRLPETLRDVIAQFPPASLQFEVGIQTFNESVAKNISRRQDFNRLAENLRFLHNHTGVHVHADLIAGLPGETLESFAAGFDRLVAFGPQEIQVGVLKRLRGTPIIRHDEPWAMVYSSHPPYEILQNRLLDFQTLQRLGRFARYWNLIANSGNFVETTPLLWRKTAAPFESFLNWSDWLYARIARRHGIALERLASLLFTYLTEQIGLPACDVADALWNDWRRAGRREKPAFLPATTTNAPVANAPALRSLVPKRQTRHLGRPITLPSSRESPRVP